MCKRTECIFHMPPSAEHGCNYIFVTGDSKLGSMPYGQKYTVDTCPYYQSGFRVKATKESPCPTPQNVRVREGLKTLRARDDDAMRMYDSGLNDIDIAKAFGVSVGTIARWRMRKGLKSKKKKSVDWEGVEKSLKDGFSRNAVAKLFDVEITAVEIYAERRKIANGGMEIEDLHEGD